MWRVWLSYFVYSWGGLHRYVGHTNSLPQEYERAAYYFALAYRIDPSFAQARLAWANLLWRELQEYETAQVALVQLARQAELAEVAHEAQFNLGMLHVERGAYWAALQSFEQYLAQAEPVGEEWHTAVRQVTLLQELLGSA